MRPTRRPLILLATLAACTAPAGDVSGRWIGPLTATPANPACPNTRGIAQVKANALIFAPDEGTWILEGAVTPNGAVTASHTRQGANKRSYITHLAATLTPESLVGTYTTPSCTYAVRLTPG